LPSANWSLHFFVGAASTGESVQLYPGKVYCYIHLVGWLVQDHFTVTQPGFIFRYVNAILFHLSTTPAATCDI